jgi:pimeloyl-ACP methyl ester carboxylesterase
MSIAEAGSPSGMPLVMLHGYTDSWRSFEPLVRHMPASFRIIALSQRGHGDSDKPMNGYSVAQFAKDTCEALDELEIASYLMLGHSMGSLVAMNVAAQMPDRVRGLVLIGAMRSVCGNVACEELWRSGVETMQDPIDRTFVRSFQESTVARPADPRFMDQVVDESLKAPAHVWRSTLRSLLDEDTKALPQRISTPTCIIWGDKDEITLSAEQQALTSAIRNSTLVIHEGGGHAPHWEAPSRVAGEISGWAEHRLKSAA